MAQTNNVTATDKNQPESISGVPVGVASMAPALSANQVGVAVDSVHK